VEKSGESKLLVLVAPKTCGECQRPSDILLTLIILSLSLFTSISLWDWIGNDAIILSVTTPHHTTPHHTTPHHTTEREQPRRSILIYIFIQVFIPINIFNIGQYLLLHCNIFIQHYVNQKINTIIIFFHTLGGGTIAK
jgi:hypothetical protein